MQYQLLGDTMQYQLLGDTMQYQLLGDTIADTRPLDYFTNLHAKYWKFISPRKYKEKNTAYRRYGEFIQEKVNGLAAAGQIIPSTLEVHVPKLIDTVIISTSYQARGGFEGAQPVDPGVYKNSIINQPDLFNAIYLCGLHSVANLTEVPSDVLQLTANRIKSAAIESAHQVAKATRYELSDMIGVKLKAIMADSWAYRNLVLQNRFSINVTYQNFTKDFAFSLGPVSLQAMKDATEAAINMTYNASKAAAARMLELDKIENEGGLPDPTAFSYSLADNPFLVVDRGASINRGYLVLFNTALQVEVPYPNIAWENVVEGEAFLDSLAIELATATQPGAAPGGPGTEPPPRSGPPLDDETDHTMLWVGAGIAVAAIASQFL